MDHERRLQGLQESLFPYCFDALAIRHLPNIRYLCGFTGSAGVLVVTDGKPAFFTDGRYTEQAQAEVRGAHVIISRKPPLPAAAAWLVDARRKARSRRSWKIGFEADHLTVAERNQFGKVLGTDFRLAVAPPLAERARMAKDRDEIKLLRAAVVLGAGLFDKAMETIRAGVREVEVAAEMEYAARGAGAEGMAFETIVASGPRSARPHGRASQARIPARGFVVCDWGVILAGYCSDRTRTVHVGRPGSEARRIYEAVLEAQLAAVAAVKPGASLEEVDAAARNVLKKNKLARHFTHSTGHGVGLEIHEAPRIAAGQKDTLQPGMVITIEPGVYISGLGGVRIEDMVVVTDQGCIVLAPTTKELIVI